MVLERQLDKNATDSTEFAFLFFKWEENCK